MTPQVHRTLLITPAYRDAALALITAVAGEGQSGMLDVPVGAEQDEETAVTHLMSTGNILEPFAALLPLDEWDGEQYVRVQEPNYDTIIAASGGAATQEGLESLFAEVVVTKDGWKETLTNLRLSICDP